jgi:hypothetical protein
MNTEQMSSPTVADDSKPMTSIYRYGLVTRVFSFPVMCLFLLVPVIFGFSVRNIAEPDIWWHLRNGEQIVLHHVIPSVDTYSFGAAGSRWMDIEWLAEVPYFLAFKAAGLRGILALYFGVLVLIYAGVYYRSCRSGADCKSATLTTLLAILLGVVSMGPRMLLFGWLSMVALLLVLDHFRQTGRGLWLAPFIFAFWINVHGSWLFGMIVFVFAIVTGMLEGSWGLVSAHKWSRPQLNKLFLALGASVCALFLNPFGYRLVFYPLDFIFRQGINVKYTQEWLPVDFATGRGTVALILLFALLASAWFSRRRWLLYDSLLAAFALWAAFSHVRMLFFAGLVIPPLIAARLTFFPAYDPEIDKPWLNAAIIVGLIAGMAFYFPSTTELQQSIESKYPANALAYMQRLHLQGRIFNPEWWGGYMEWNAPELKTFVDGRADIFIYNGSFGDHIKATLIDDSLEVLNKYKINLVLIEPRTALAYLLEHSSGWHIIYSDKVAIVFERTAGLQQSGAESGHE